VSLVSPGLAAVPTGEAPSPATSVRWREPRPTPSWWRASSRDLAALSLLFVIGLWWRGGNLTSLTQGSAAAFTSLGRLTGLVSADLLLIQVWLMARVPFIERSWGQDTLARVHRLVGFSSFTLMLAHIALITLGYAPLDRRNVIVELWHLTWTYPGMLLAMAGTLSLVMVAVTSIRIARRRLRYESWHLLHLYAYLGVGLALPHQLWTGSDFLLNPWATWYWWSAWATTAAAVIGFRLGLPGYRSWRHRLFVHEVVTEAPGVFSLHLRGRHLEELPLRAGQFFQFRFLNGVGMSRAHPFSISAAPRPEWIRVTVKALGDGSSGLPRVRPGTRVLIEGPYGRLTSETRTRRKALLLGAGIGITPLRALAEDFQRRRGDDVVLIHRIHSNADRMFVDELTEFARRGLQVRYLTGPRVAKSASWAPASMGSDEVAALRTAVPDVADRDVYVCGPDGWMDAALAAARGAGVPESQLHAERFTW
jgi:predicted ferric reductase